MAEQFDTRVDIQAEPGMVWITIGGAGFYADSEAARGLAMFLWQAADIADESDAIDVAQIGMRIAYPELWALAEAAQTQAIEWCARALAAQETIDACFDGMMEGLERGDAWDRLTDARRDSYRRQAAEKLAKQLQENRG